jgi:hypothetical protein
MCFIISLAQAPLLVTDFSVVNVHVEELSSARIWQHKLCATYFACVNINNRLPHVLMSLYPIDKSLVFYKAKEGRHVRI